MNEQPLDLRSTLQGVRRRWRVVASLFAIGILCGTVVGFGAKPMFSARSGVLLPASPVDERGQPLRNVDTQVNIAASAAVLDRAARTLHPPGSVRTLRRQVSVRALSPDILEIRARVPSARRAAEVANAVAKEYVAYSIGTTSEDAQLETAALREQADALARRIREYEGEITAETGRLRTLDQGSPEGRRLAARVDSLRFAQLEAARQLSALDTRIAEAQLEAELSRAGLRILEPSLPPTDPIGGRLLTPMGIGGLAGLITGVVGALALEHRDRRLRRRDDIAGAVGAPVWLSMGVPGRFRDADCRAVYTQGSVGPVERYGLSQSFARLRSLTLQAPTALVLVALPGDRAALLLALHVAVFAARSGARTRLWLPERDETCTMLRAACIAAAKSNPSACPRLEISTLEEAASEDRGDSPLGFTVTLLIGGNGPLEVPARGDRTLTALVVSSGFATHEQLASVALACLEARHPIRAVFVANPDPADRSTGHLPEPLPVELGDVDGETTRGGSPALMEKTESA